MHSEVQIELAKGLSKTRDEIAQKMADYFTLVSKVKELPKELTTLRACLGTPEGKVHEIELQLASDATAIARLAILVKYHRSNCLCGTFENCK